MTHAMARRPLGRTALEITELGLGTAPLGGLFTTVEREDADAALEASLAGGIRFVDTAPLYGFGAAERRVGDALRSLPRDELVLQSKVGRLLRPTPDLPETVEQWSRPLPFTPVYDYTYDGVMRSFEDSLQRLGLARIDLLLLHDIGRFQHGEAHDSYMKDAMEGGQKALVELKKSGVIGGFGIGVNEIAVCLETLRHGDWDCFLLAGRYTLLEQDALDELLPECERRRISIVCGGPFNSGLLAGGSTWNYEAAPAELLQRRDRLDAVCARHEVPLKAAALQFPLHHPAVASVVPGARNRAEAEENLELVSVPIPGGLWNELREERLLRDDAPLPAFA